MSAPVTSPVGRWWLAYDDGTVWPIEIIAPSMIGEWRVRPVHPAPDAGQERYEPTGRIFDADFNHPRMV